MVGRAQPGNVWMPKGKPRKPSRISLRRWRVAEGSAQKTSLIARRSIRSAKRCGGQTRNQLPALDRHVNQLVGRGYALHLGHAPG